MRVGAEAEYRWGDQEMPPEVQSFLRSLVSGRNFSNPVDWYVIPVEHGLVR
jgi:hypothetical protein